MLLLTLFVCVIFTVQPSEQTQNFISDNYQSDTLPCLDNKKCIFIEHCPAISNLMERKLLPIHRFRQTICSYDNLKPQVCCDVDSNTLNPNFVDDDSIYFPGPSSVPECGKSLIRSNVDTVGTYPFVARIGFINRTGGIKYSCSGVIINQRTIATTASCALAKSENYKLYTVLVGEFDSETNPDCNNLYCGHVARNYNISYVIKHPNYHAETFTNNIALLRLEEPICFTVTTQPICILPRDRFINLGSTATLVGWGKLSNERVKMNKQQSLNMRVISNEECLRYYTQGLPVELCAMGDEMPCSGYSGSPLIHKHGDTYFLLGILSYGSNCNTGVNFPSVFINVQRYTRWILENC